MAERKFLFMNGTYGYPEEAYSAEDTTTLRGAEFTHKWLSPAAKVVKLVSDEDMDGADPTDPVLGDAWVVNNWLTGTDGDIVEWDGSAWNVIVANSAGEPPDGTIVLVTDGTPAGSFAAKDGQIATYDATEDEWIFDEPAEGWFVRCDGDGSLYQYAGLVYVAASTSWRIAYGDTYETEEANRVEDEHAEEEATTIGSIVRWGTVNNQVKLADNGAGNPANAANAQAIGVVRATDGVTAQVVKCGVCVGAISGAVVNTPYYLGAAGALVIFANVPQPGRVVRIGFAKNATDLDVQIMDFGWRRN